jgi:glycosyltransferase 2 family protein
MSRRAVWIALVVGLPVSALLLWLATRNVDLDRVGETLADASLGTVAAAVAVMGFVFFVQAVRWRGIVGLDRPSRARYFELVIAGLACNNVLPGRLGDFLRARWIAVDANLPSGRGLATIVLDRTFDVVALAIFVCVSVPLVVDETWIARIAVGALILLVGVALVRVLARRYTSSHARDRRGRSIVRTILRDTLEGLAEPLGRKRVAKAAALSLAAWGMWAFGAILVASSLGIELGLLDALFVAAVVNLGVAIPSSPGYVGTYHWLCVESLGMLGIGREEALAFSILLHATWYVPTTVAGVSILALRIDWRSFRARSIEPGPVRGRSSVTTG